MQHIPKDELVSSTILTNNLILLQSVKTNPIYLGFPNKSYSIKTMRDLFDQKLAHIATRSCSGSTFMQTISYCTFKVKDANLKTVIETAGKLNAYLYVKPCLLKTHYTNETSLLLDYSRYGNDFYSLKDYSISSVEITKIVL
jgi:hypothetical protein